MQFPRLFLRRHFHSRSQSLLGAWARGPGGSGDTGFEVLDFRTSGHFWFSTAFLTAFTCSCRSVNDCKFRWFKAFKRESSNLLLNRKWPEVLKSRNLNPVSPEPPGPRAQAPRRPWGREWRHFAEKLVVVSRNDGRFFTISALKNTIKTRRMAANMHETTKLHCLPTIHTTSCKHQDNVYCTTTKANRNKYFSLHYPVMKNRIK